MAARTAHEVFEDHLRLRREHDIESDLARNYADDVVLLCADGALLGKDAIRRSASRLRDQLPDGRFEYKTCLMHGPYAFLEWSATSDRYRIEDGADSYVIEQGLIRMQSIHYTLLGDPDQ